MFVDVKTPKEPSDYIFLYAYKNVYLVDENGRETQVSSFSDIFWLYYKELPKSLADKMLQIAREERDKAIEYAKQNNLPHFIAGVVIEGLKS